MNSKINLHYFFLLMLIALSSCNKNEFKVVSNNNILIKNSEISSLKVTELFVNKNFEKLYIPREFVKKKRIDYREPTFYEILVALGNTEEANIYAKKLRDKTASEYKTNNENYSKQLKEEKYEREQFEKEINEADIKLKKEIKNELLKEKLKGIRSKISILNNSNQIIENSSLTVVIKYTFENEKIFNYIKPYKLLSNNKVWKKDETLDFQLNDVINFSEYAEQKILEIHTPTKVKIEYYITARNSLDFDNLGKNKETQFLKYPNEFYNGSAKIFGMFTSKIIKENEILGFGDRIYSEDITDIWNININSDIINQTDRKQKNGDLDKTFVSQETLNKQNEVRYKKEKKRLISEGWKDEEIENGQLSSCYNLKPTKGTLKNRLEVIVGGGTDVSIKIMNMNTEKCIRYVFVNSGTTHIIENIPEGKYYLKIAYGKDWLSKVENGQCVGKFIKNPLYEKGEDFLNFNIQRNNNGRIIPSYQLSLDVVSSGISNSFNSQNISESEFNK